MKRKHCFKMLLVPALLFILSSCSKKEASDKLTIGFEKYTMPNGLQVILHTDHSDPMISYTIMYHTGSSRELPGKTGFAHLFEHLLFGGSENVPSGKFDKVIEGAGGMNNGFTNRDVTTYYEEFPRNALEKVLWLESDRMGFFINSVTPRLLAIQQNVVQNEKRQGEDNSPYGFTEYVILKNLYPQGHPYSWEVIGEMEDLRNATLDDVRTYYDKFYGPNNATLVLSGDFDPDSAKLLLNKYFSEIKPHGDAGPRSPMPVSAPETKKLFHEDNFANVPELTMVWPVPQQYSKDSYALDFLARILADGKKAPFYKVLVKEKQLTSAVDAFNNASELAGEFTISIRANDGRSLKEIGEAVTEAFARFEKDGLTQNDVERIKAMSEKNFYENISGILGKSIQLAFYNTLLKDPGFIEKDIENIKSVTKEDILRVYETYIKDKPHVVTSFVPKGKPELAASGSMKAEIREENITEASQVDIAQAGNEQPVKSPSALDRTVEPPAGPEPEVKVPQVWKAELKNGIQVYGIENSELPLVSMKIVIDGGASCDDISKPGVASLTAAVLPLGTKNKTPEQLEEEIELLGSEINVFSGREEITMSASMLSRNFDRTVTLLKEILLEPRWDTAEFRLARIKTKNNLIQSEARPGSVASNAFYRLVYGDRSIFGYNPAGNRETIDNITIDDLKSYYEKNFSPSSAKILISGKISKEQALSILNPLAEQWKGKEVRQISWPQPVAPEKSVIYFIDIPGSRQSVVYAGYPCISRTNPDYVKIDFINYRLGGAFTSILNQILREEKGYTYGASSYLPEMRSVAPFTASTSVRSDATYETVRIIREELEKYGTSLSDADISFIKNCMIRSNALRFETNDALAGMLSTMAKYGFPADYIKNEENIIRNMTLEDSRAVASKYIRPDKMYYLVVGDAATQLGSLEKIGFGKPVLIER
jgi:zinc protease